MESELFGHEKGAFTGADRRRIGKFEQSHGGTLFLDEIGDMTPLTQAEILRVMQDQRFGASVVPSIASNRCTDHYGHQSGFRGEVAAGQFRRDLYYRLNVYTLRLPPLRDRLEDLPDSG